MVESAIQLLKIPGSLDRLIRYHKWISTDSMESGAIPRLLEG